MSEKKIKPINFSLVLGGPLYQLYLRIFIAKPPLHLWKRRVIFITLITWLPLLVLSVIDGKFLGGAKVTFLYDFDTHARFLLALGLLVIAEVGTHNNINMLIGQFIERNIIANEDRKRFNNAINTAMRFRNSIAVEVLILVFVFTIGHWIWQKYITIGTSTWYATEVGGVRHITPAGYWYYFFSLPVFQFILLRWYFRLLVWYRFLWVVSRMPLHLNGLHPDRSGGLGFLLLSLPALSPFLIAHTILISGLVLNRIWYFDVTLKSYEVEIVCSLIYLILIVVMPITFFSPKLISEKRIKMNEYGALASHYVSAFYGKWIGSESNKNASILGSPDIQSMADLNSSFQVVREMRVTPLDSKTLVQLFIIISLPFLPLVFFMIPLESIAQRLIRLFF